MITQTELFFSRLFNISRHEWGRVMAAWTLKFLLQTATVLGFTLMTVFFVEQSGIEKLPILFVFQSLFSIVGALLFANILKTTSNKTLFLVGGILGTGLILVSAVLDETTSYLFWTFLLLTFSVVIAQMNILLALLIEELFTPLESERTFPVIESAEPFGTMMAGIITASGVLVFHLHAHDFLWFWAGFMAILVPVFFFLQQRLEPVPAPTSQRHIRERLSKREEIKEMWTHVQNIPFLKGLLIIIFLHFFAFNLVEFQYTKAVDLYFVHETAAGDHSGAAEQLTHGLGRLHIIISSLFLISQLLVASRVMKRFGLMRSILIHPLTSLISSAYMFFQFSFMSAVSTKSVFEVVGGLKRNAYHASFYALRPKVREQAKEFLEGIARPFGMMLGTLLLLFLQRVFSPDMHDMVVSMTLVAIFGLMFLQAIRLSQRYTFLAKKNLETHGHAPEKLDAIEILAQKGHRDPVQYLVKSLEFRRERPEVQVKILKTLGILSDPMAIPEVLKFLHDPQQEVQLSAVRALSQYTDLAHSPFTQTFSQHRVVEALQKLFVETKSKKVKLAIIQVFRNINHKDIVPFLLQALDSGDLELKADVIYVCGMFADVSTAYYLEKYIHDAHPRIKSNAIIALWKFVPYRLKLLMKLNAMLESNDQDDLLSGIYAVGEARLIQEIPRLQKLLRHEHDNIRKHAAISLLKLGENEAIEHVIEFILHPEKRLSESAKKLLRKGVDSTMRKAVERRLTQKISERIHHILKEANTEILEDMSDAILRRLLEAYEILGEEREMLEIIEILENRKKESFQKNSPETPAQKRNEKKQTGGISLADLL